MAMEYLTHNNAPFGQVGFDSDGNPPGYREFHLTHDYIPPCDTYPGGTWLKPGTYTYKLEEHKKSKIGDRGERGYLPLEPMKEDDEFYIETDENGQKYLIRLVEGYAVNAELYKIELVVSDVNRDTCERWIEATAKENKDG